MYEFINIKIRHKLIFIILIPAVAFAYLSFMNIQLNSNRYSSMKEIVVLTNIAIHAGDVMHSLQKEHIETSDRYQQSIATNNTEEVIDETDLDEGDEGDLYASDDTELDEGDATDLSEGFESEVDTGDDVQQDEDNDTEEDVISKQNITAGEATENVNKTSVNVDVSIKNFFALLLAEKPLIDQKIKYKKSMLELKSLLTKYQGKRQDKFDDTFSLISIDKLYSTIQRHILDMVVSIVNISEDTTLSKDANSLIILMELNMLIGKEQVLLNEAFQKNEMTDKQSQDYFALHASKTKLFTFFSLVADKKYVKMLKKINNGKLAKRADKYRTTALNQSDTFDIKAKDWMNAQDLYFGEISKLEAIIRQALTKQADLLGFRAMRALIIDITSFIVILALSGFLVTLVLRTFNKNISDVISIIKRVSAGDLTVKMGRMGKDELGEILLKVKAMCKKLNSTVMTVQDSAVNIHRVAVDTATQNEHLALRTQESATNIQETSASMEQMSATIQQSSEHAQQVSILGRSAHEIANQSALTVEEAVQAMNEVDEASGKISEIIEVIEEISFQTNLLALNAAVEASSAGEYGKGFAVVAQEVRNLSQRSSESSNEIKELILNTVEKVKNGSLLVNKTGESFKQIIDSINKVSLISEEVAAAAQEQSQGVFEVNKAVNELDQGTQKNAELVENLNKSSQKLKTLANGLKDVVGFFTTAKEPSSQDQQEGADGPTDVSCSNSQPQ